MAKVLSFPYTDTPIPDVTTNETSIGLVNFDLDWKTEKLGPTEYVMTNLKSPIGYPERFRIHWSAPNTLYQGTGIEPSMRSQSSRMVSLLIQHECVATITDTVDLTYQVDVPCKSNIVLKVGMIPEMTGAIALGLVQRNLAGLFDTGVNTSARLDALLRGSLKPANVG